jgi:hypothetical protein
MNDLLTLAVGAHGGLSRWNRFTTLTATASITGAIWPAKGQPDALANIRVEAQLHSQIVIIHQLDRGTRLIFTPQRVALEAGRGEITHGIFSRARRSSVRGTTCISAISAVTPSGRI